MKIVLLTIVALCFAVSTQACEPGEVAFSQTNVCAKINWITGPVLDQYNSASIALKNNSNYKLNVMAWMVMGAGHEHGSRPVKITSASPDDYLVEKIYFMGGMMGDWFLKLQLLNDSKELVEEARLKIEL